MYEILLAAALQTCVIVVPTDQQRGNLSPRLVYEHELAHTNGWVHGSDGTNIRNLLPPRSYVHKPTHCRLEVMHVPTKVAEKVCHAMGGDSYACEWEE
jgi:hypothetical protein